MREHTVIAPAGDTTTPLARPGYCGHASARHIRVYMPYADANTLRLRTAHTTGESPTSWLYAVPGGWGWTICSDCQSRARKSA